jgi:GGDEF domain-containing protein
MKKELEMTRKYFDSNEIPTRRMLWNKIIELQVKLYYDPLTSVYNRKYYQDVIEKEYATKECYVMMADINNLKQINDEYGW